MDLDDVNEQIDYYRNLISDLEDEINVLNSDIENIEILKNQYSNLYDTFFQVRNSKCNNANQLLSLRSGDSLGSVYRCHLSIYKTISSTGKYIRLMDQLDEMYDDIQEKYNELTNKYSNVSSQIDAYNNELEDLYDTRCVLEEEE